MNISILQYDIQWMDRPANINTIAVHLKNSKEVVDLLVLPEMCLTGFNMDAKNVSIEESDTSIQKLVVLCDHYDTAIIGSFAICETNTFYNRALLIDKTGIIGRYDKQYLYSPSGENVAFDKKHPTQLIEFMGWKILPQVCYDLRFPENVRSIESPDLLIYMANWPSPRIHHWDALLAARAIENQCFVVGCNRIGTDKNDWEFPGHSQLIKPDGRLNTRRDKKGDIQVNMSIDEVRSYREKYKFQEDKKDVSLTFKV